MIELVVPRRRESDFKCVNFKHKLEIDIFIIQVNVSLELMPEDHIDGKSTLVQVMAWCHQAPNPGTKTITWTRDDQDLPCHMASVGHNELTQVAPFTNMV